MTIFTYLSLFIMIYLVINTSLGYRKMLLQKPEKYHYEHDQKVYDYKQLETSGTIMGHTVNYGDKNSVAKKGIIFDAVLLCLVTVGLICGTLVKRNPLGYVGVLTILLLFGENICEYLHMTGKGMTSNPIISFIPWAIAIEAITLIICLILIL